MSLESFWPVPFILDPNTFAIDAAAAFCVSVLIAVTINAEAQAFMANFLGDYRPGAKDRLHFNAFLHLGVLGSICYLVGGFGWPRTLEIDPGKFEHPRLYTVLTRVAGPVANLLMGSIAGSIAMLMNAFQYNPRVFLMVIGVNITTAIYNLIPIPPLAGGVLLSELLPRGFDRVKWWCNQIGPYLIMAIILLERIRGESPFGGYLDPVVVRIFNYIKG